MQRLDTKAAEVKRELTRLTDEFCTARLNAEYKRLCRDAVGALAIVQPLPFLSGKIEGWAAGIVHAIASNNGMFYETEERGGESSGDCRGFPGRDGDDVQAVCRSSRAVGP